MGKRTRTILDHRDPKARTLPPSPSHSFSSSSSSDFEFTISVSPRKSSNALCPADELFYKGQLLPLHLSPRLSMVRTLLLASSSTSSSSDTSTTSTTASRDSTGSSNDSQHSFNSELVLPAESCDSSRRASSVTEDEEFKRLTTSQSQINISGSQIKNGNNKSTTNKYFSLSRFSSVFKKDQKQNRGAGEADNMSGSSVKRMSTTAKEVIRKYLKKVKPLYEKLSQKQYQQQQQLHKLGRLMTVPANSTTNAVSFSTKSEKSTSEADQLSGKSTRKDGGNSVFSHSFSGNLRYPRRKSCISSCPSSIRSSPSHSGVLCRPGFGGGRGGGGGGGTYNYADTSSMEELQNAIQGAIAHCKNSLVQSNMKSTTMVSNEI